MFPVFLWHLCDWSTVQPLSDSIQKTASGSWAVVWGHSHAERVKGLTDAAALAEGLGAGPASHGVPPALWFSELCVWVSEC